MSISYSAIVGRGKVTLPSVDTWGTNMNILKDPPKSITTRRVDRVGSTSDITVTIDDAGDRFNDSILPFARGVNPMVAVDYSNYGNNGGQRSGTLGSNTQSFLPYRVMRDGAFRPPIVDQRSLLPLSRQPRIWTSSYTKPGFADFSKKAICQGEASDYRQIKSEMLRPCANINVTYKLETPILENYEVKSVIKNPVRVEVNAGYAPNTRIMGEISAPYAQIQDALHANANANKSDITRDGDHTYNTDKYIQNSLHADIDTTRTQNINITPIEEIYHPTRTSTKAVHNINYNVEKKGLEQNDFGALTNLQLDRSLPQYQATTNKTENRQIFQQPEKVRELYSNHAPISLEAVNRSGMRSIENNIMNRQVKLKPTISSGGMEGLPTMPTQQRQSDQITMNMEKNRLRQSMYEMQTQRVMPVN